MAPANFPPPSPRPRLSSCNLIKLLTTVSDTSASHPSIVEWRMHAAEAWHVDPWGPPPPPSPSHAASIDGEDVASERQSPHWGTTNGSYPHPPANSRLSTSSSRGIRSMGMDSNEFIPTMPPYVDETAIPS